MNSLVLVILGMVLMAAALAILGVYLLAGTPYALLAAAAALFGGAFSLRSGLTPNV